MKRLILEGFHYHTLIEVFYMSKKCKQMRIIGSLRAKTGRSGEEKGFELSIKWESLLFLKNILKCYMFILSAKCVYL